jgi:uncharacterized membrane protein YfcA
MELAYCLVAIFFASLVRGYAGFGFSALVAASLTLILPPAEIIPIILLMEVAASIAMLPSVWRDVDWKKLLVICIGAAIGTPLGVYLLVTISEDSARVVICTLILSASIALLRGYMFRGAGGPALTVSTGFASGIANGVASIGGLPIVIFLLASASGAASTRAFIVAFLFVLDIYGSLLMFNSGLLNAEVVTRFVIFLAPLILGVILGSRQFIRTSPESFRQFALVLLIVLALSGLVRSLVL